MANHYRIGAVLSQNLMPAFGNVTVKGFNERNQRYLVTYETPPPNGIGQITSINPGNITGVIYAGPPSTTPIIPTPTRRSTTSRDGGRSIRRKRKLKKTIRRRKF